MSNELKKQRASVAVTVALEQVHNSIDIAIADAATLIAKTATARTEIGASGIVAQQELELLHADLGLLFQARQRSIDRHAGLAELARSLDLPIFSDGGFNKPPKIAILEHETQALAA